MTEKQYKQLCCELMNRRLCNLWTLTDILEQYIKPYGKCCDNPCISEWHNRMTLLHNPDMSREKQEYVWVEFVRCDNCGTCLDTYIC